MKYGIFYEYWEKDWGGDYRKYAAKIAELGFDCLEVGAGDLLDMSKDELRELKRIGDGLGISYSANIGPAKEYDVGSREASVRKKGIRFLEDIMDRMTVLGSDKLVGVQYSFWPYDFEDLDKEGLWARSAESVRTLGKHAGELGITMCLEVVNRFETILLNTAEEGVRYCEDVNCPNVKLLLDTFHMNIEEDDIPSAIRLAGRHLGHLHVGENNRKLPGQGISTLDWRLIGESLHDIAYDGAVVMEPFITAGGSIAKDIKVWRDLGGSADESTKDEEERIALRFLKEHIR